MGLDVLIIVVFSLGCTTARSFVPQAQTSRLNVKSAFLWLHRGFVIAITLVEAMKWRSGASTVLVKDWLQEDMGYVLYLPVLVIELMWALWRIVVAVKEGEYQRPSAKDVILRALPDLLVWGAVGVLAVTTSH